MADARAERIESLLPSLAVDPTVYLHSLDLALDRGLVLEVDRRFYRDAAFLDERVLDPQRVGAWVPLARIWPLVETAPLARLPCNFIFHLGHAGSTLLSRLLDEVPGVLGLREPLALRPLALAANRLAHAPDAEFAAVCARALPNLHALLARRFAPLRVRRNGDGDRAVVVKTTSICSAIAPRLLAQHADDRAVVMTVGLRAYLANTLDKPISDDLIGFASHRGAGLRARVAGFGLELAGQPPARLAALSWLAEVVALAPLHAERRALFVDFDALLAARTTILAQVLDHLGLPVEAAAAMASSPAFGVYSKQTDHAFGPEARRQVLARSWQANRDAILDAEGFVASLAGRHPELASAMAAHP